MSKESQNIFPPLKTFSAVPKWRMLNFFTYFFLIFFIAISETAANNESNIIHEVPPTALSFETKTILVNFNPKQEEKMHQATSLLKRVIATKEFKDGVLNHLWRGKKQFVDNKGLSNTEIYTKILEAAESYHPENNHSLDVELELYHESNNTIGYTFPQSKRIWMNKKYYDKFNPIQISDNLFHEWLHKIGFDHATTWSYERDHSVPYALGYLVERIAAQFSPEKL